MDEGLDSGKPGVDLEIREVKDIIANSIDKLPEKEKIVVTLYYYEELTLKEISKILEVSESRVSQLHTKAIMRMKGKLEKQRALILG